MPRIAKKAQPLPHRAAIYVRVSTIEQAQKGTVSLDTQVDGCKAWALSHGYPLVADEHIFTDTHSGEEYYERPALARLRERAKAREFDVVVVWVVDRLGRDPVHQGVAMMELERAGVHVEFAHESIDDTPEGQLVRFVKGYAAKIENASRVERMTRAKREYARRGKPVFGARPLYGYQFNADKTAYLEDPLKAPIVRRLFNEILQGNTLSGIAAALTNEGVPTPRGMSQYWHASAIKLMLMTPSYWGKHVAFRTKRVKLTPEERPNYLQSTRLLWNEPENQILISSDIVPPLVSEEIAMAVQERLRLNKELATRNSHNPESMLLQGSFIRCGHCGTTMMVRRIRASANTPRDRIDYVCRKAAHYKGACYRFGISANIIDNAVWSFVIQVLGDPDIIVQEAARIQEVGTDKHESLADIDAKILAKERTIANIRRLAADVDDPATTKDLARDISMHSQEKRGLEDMRAAATAFYDGRERQKNDLTQLRAWLGSIGDPSALTVSQKRHVLATLGIVAVIRRRDDGDRIVIEMNLPLQRLSATQGSTGGFSMMYPLPYMLFSSQTP